MKGRIVWILVLFFALSQAAEYRAPAVHLVPEAVVLARLAEMPAALDTSRQSVYIYKYRLERVERGQVGGRELYVGHYNPWRSRSQIADTMANRISGNVRHFRTGDLHRLSLIRPLEKIWNATVHDDFFDDASVRWFALSTDMGM